MIIGMIIIRLRFDGGSAGEKHDIAHIASSIVARPMAGFFLPGFRRPASAAYVPRSLLRRTLLSRTAATGRAQRTPPFSFQP